MDEKPHKSQRYLNALRECFVKRPSDHRTALQRQPMACEPGQAQLKGEFSRLTRTEMEAYVEERFNSSAVEDILSMTDEIDQNDTQPQIISIQCQFKQKYGIKYEKVPQCNEQKVD